MNAPIIGWSDFALRFNRKEEGNSYTTLPNIAVITAVQEAWAKRRPGTGETGLYRKVLVPIEPTNFFYCPPRAELQMGLPVQAAVFQRQAHEDPTVQTYVRYEDAVKHGVLIETPANRVDIVCYSADALTENGETRTDPEYEWEIVTILCSGTEELEPMRPLAMARNFLEKPGGTKSVYTAEQFAEAIWYWSQQGIRVKA